MNETTSDAIRFLLIGAGTLFVLRMAHVGILRWIASPATSDLTACIAQFRNGYWITDPDTLVSGGMGMGERLALAMVVAVAISVLVASIVLVVVRILGRPASKPAVNAARLTLVIVSLWFAFAAVMLPVRAVQLGPEGFTRTVRPAILGELSLPFGAHKDMHPWGEVAHVEVRITRSSAQRQMVLHEVVAIQGDGLHPLLSIRASEVSDPGVTLRIERLAGLIRSTYLDQEHRLPSGHRGI